MNARTIKAEAEIKAMIAAMTPEEREILLAEMERSLRDEALIAGAAPDVLAAFFVSSTTTAAKLRTEGKNFEAGFSARTGYAAIRAIGGIEKMRAAITEMNEEAGLINSEWIADKFIAKHAEFSLGA